jgi:hypothetical protein
MLLTPPFPEDGHDLARRALDRPVERVGAA